MKKAFLGTFWKTEKDAIKDILKKEKKYKRRFFAIGSEKGFIVISESKDNVS